MVVYQGMYKEEKQKKGAEEQGGLLAPPKKKLGGLYEMVFGAPMIPAEGN